MHKHMISLTLVSYFVFLLLLPFVAAEASEQYAYEMPRTEVVPIQDSISGGQYELYIKLPDGYSTNTEGNYPVIYTTDAVWHFEMLSGSTEYLMPGVILVGISWQKDLDDDREFFSRFRDYSVLESETTEIPTGKASNHLSFIRSDVIKYVEKNYRTDPAERTYFGYSLGGLFGAYVLLAEPSTFNHYILGSPSLGPRRVKYFDELEKKMAPQQQSIDTNVFVSIGELEQSKMDVTKDFVSVLRRRSQAGLTLTGLKIIEDSNHSTAFPVTVVRSIRWLSQLRSE